MLVNIHEAKAQISHLVERVARGEEIVIGKAGKPVAKLVPYSRALSPRSPGAWKGRVRIAEDFDDLPAEFAAAFHDENV